MFWNQQRRRKHAKKASFAAPATAVTTATRRKRSREATTRNSLLNCFSKLLRSNESSSRSSSPSCWSLLRLVGLFVACAVGYVSYRALDWVVRWTRLPKYANHAERSRRQERFPSVEQRIQIYASQWYPPPCEEKYNVNNSSSSASVVYYRRMRKQHHRTSDTAWWKSLRTRTSNNDDYYYEITELPDSSRNNRTESNDASTILDTVPRTFLLSPHAMEARMFVLERDDLMECHMHKNWTIRDYCSDAADSMLLFQDVPIVVQFSDQTVSWAQERNEQKVAGNEMDGSLWQANPRIPHVKKIRHALTHQQRHDLTQRPCHSGIPARDDMQLQPLLWLLNINRHFKYSMDVPRYDVQWHAKKDAAVFRGLLTGLDYDRHAASDASLVNCQRLIRCKLVYEQHGSERVDAKLTSTFGKLPEVVNGIPLTGSPLKKEELLQYKGLILLEGNDVASGLKWGMVSKSVVLMPPPRFTSWSMEELLEPWVHYIPLAHNLSNVADQVDWMLAHPAEAQRISHRATLWILDLYFHPDAMEDNRRINREVLRRYRSHFRAAADGNK